MLAIQFGLTHFHNYVYGREVTVETDHQPLVRICTKPLVELSPRLQRMKMKMQPYEFKVVHVPGKDMYVSDYLSRSCESGTMVQDLSIDDPLIQICDIVIRSSEVKNEYTAATNQDGALQVVLAYTKNGWPKQKRLCHPLAKPYWQHRVDIAELDGLVFLGDRLIVPYAKQAEIISQLHEGHLGINKTQQRACSAVFWPGISRQIEDRVSSCTICKQHDTVQSHAPLIPSEIPDYPWQVVGSDIFQVQGTYYLLNVDYYSKWVNVSKLEDLTTKSVISEFSKQFADFGRASTIRSDNGPQYSSTEFKVFVKQLGITHKTSSPGYPRSNGLAERAIQTVKKLMIKAIEDGKCFWHALQMQRNAPIDTDLPSPAQLLQGRNLYDGIPVKQHCLFPRAYDRKEIHAKFLNKQEKMKLQHDSKASRERTVLTTGQPVRFKTLQGEWEKATVVSHHESNRSYNIVNNATGVTIRRNREVLRPDLTQKRSVEKNVTVTKPMTLMGRVETGKYEGHSTPKAVSKLSAKTADREVTLGNSPPGHDCSNIGRENPEEPGAPVTTTRSGRVVKKPLRFRD